MPTPRKKGSDVPHVAQSGHNVQPKMSLRELADYLQRKREESKRRRSERAIQNELPMGQPALEVCTDCGGTGHDKKGKRCGVCRGEGVKESLTKRVGDDTPRPKVECPKCYGVGSVARETSAGFQSLLCPRCHGLKEVDAE